MSVAITFHPEDRSGIIAEGTYLIDAAKRMGLSLPADCHERGECTACVVSIVAGQSLLSAPTSAERKMLTEERLAKDHRLACQTKIESSGDLVVRLIPQERQVPGDPQQESALRFNNKYATMVEREAQHLFKTFDAIMDKSRSAGESMLDRFVSRARLARERERESKRPPEHRHRRDR
ncbi:MAG: 2Fe-2S iron-sulfur cluster-binding protein [Pyrinomonadaceae bacterium]